ncbi:sulfite exporter TauE/SafE family protein [Flavobacterium sp. LMO8]|uniref:sulfite exporter TauE/SafE family protein n=1 Tax=Flavobacterium sp. LMO8 TaxID=2654244 RepID=UPI00129125D1|nr:sulfite exporter TauE/SafE family protein [Flavobacterium sp. LMO8]MQP23477.1 sulfite exporter TauE/SafE family protein [Flavobacterium sp. LMO8]
MLYSAFIFGLISSFHCIGMCGPIAMMLPVDRNNEVKKITQIITYHIGKLVAYGILGLVFGLLGRSFYLAGMQQQLSIIVGILMILVAVIPEKVFAKYNFSKPVYRIITKVKSSLGQQFKNKSYKSLFTIGLLNGFLPCGIVYVALFGAIAMQNVNLGIGYMLLFGLGTIPMMVAVVYASGLISFSYRGTIQKAIPLVAVIIGMLFIIRGLGLDIPYLSPSNMSLFVQSEANCH